VVATRLLRRMIPMSAVWLSCSCKHSAALAKRAAVDEARHGAPLAPRRISDFLALEASARGAVSVALQPVTMKEPSDNTVASVA
jgi:hypothetical protein